MHSCVHRERGREKRIRKNDPLAIIPYTFICSSTHLILWSDSPRVKYVTLPHELKSACAEGEYHHLTLAEAGPTAQEARQRFNGTFTLPWEWVCATRHSPLQYWIVLQWPHGIRDPRFFICQELRRAPVPTGGFFSCNEGKLIGWRKLSKKQYCNMIIWTNYSRICHHFWSENPQNILWNHS